MGPASENAGYAIIIWAWRNTITKLQWVRRPRTPVMLVSFDVHPKGFEASMVRRPRTPVMLYGKPEAVWLLHIASMGPASENAGYAGLALSAGAVGCFNGSGVRERRLCQSTRFAQ